MTAEVTIEGGGRLSPHPLRAASWARCMPGRSRRSRRRAASCISPSRPPASAAQTRPRRPCRSASGAGSPLPAAAKHHRVAVRHATLRWEQHSEFTTYTWEMPADRRDPVPSRRRVAGDADAALPQPGPCWSRSTCILMAEDEPRSPAAAVRQCEPCGGRKFRWRGDLRHGLPARTIRLRAHPCADRNMSPERAGALVQRVIELETYRTLALLGLPEAQRLAPSIAASSGGWSK